MKVLKYASKRIILLQNNKMFSSQKKREEEEGKDLKIERMKATPVQTESRRKNLMEKKKVFQLYQLLKSSPNDNIETITSNYINLKQLYSKRQFYIPHKRDYLQNLDQAYDQILTIHHHYNYASLILQTPPIVKSDIINEQLDSAKKYDRLKRAQTPEFGIFLLCFFIMSLGFYEELTEKERRYRISDSYERVKGVKEKFDGKQKKQMLQIKSKLTLVLEKQQKKELEQKKRILG